VRDAKYSIVLICILSIGLSAWVIMPSISDNLEGTLYDYSTRVATYVTVSLKGDTGGLPPANGLPPSVIEEIKGLRGVENVYSFRANFTRFVFHNVPIVTISPNGTTSTTYSDVDAGMFSAPIGQGYFPLDLVSLIEGRLPGNQEAGFLSNCDGHIDIRNNSPLTVNSTYTVRVGSTEFNAIATGRNTINYLYADVCVLWNSMFLQQELGVANFTATFGGPPNFAIIKVDSINDVREVAESLGVILKDFRGYIPIYDQAAIVDLQNLQKQTIPLYHLIAVVGILFATSVSFFASILATGRRSWESGLLISQGWSRLRILGSTFAYYGTVSLIAFVISAILTESASKFAIFQYWVYGTKLMISTPVSRLYLFSAIPIALLISGVVALVESIRVRNLRLETALRDY